ncbi:hypothetical protein [Actinopolymorpha alba]|uniref:hypothetical protein n=1 Tax=Actinopolymorpha alba TaxID=533267 RepID=UPI0003621CC2|nr:hypothetical protein [Actinopolymorpha alba]
MESATQRAFGIVSALLADYRFAGMASIVHVLDLPERVRREVDALATAGERLLDLDAEDFDLIAADRVLPDDVVAPVQAAHFPREPFGDDRGSLRSLVPLFALMLEAVDIRWRRREPVHVVVLLHLIAEYLPLLAWESVLGHAGDPRDLTAFVRVPDSRWGLRAGKCDHTAAQRSAAQRVENAMRGDTEGWTVYLDRFHSRVSDALARCASHPVPGRPAVEGVCRAPCSVWTQLAEDVRQDLGARVHLARMYAASPVVALRHHAPVGHFFGVPAPSEIEDTWHRSFARLVRPWENGTNPLLASPVDPADGRGEALPGFSALVSAVAGRAVQRGTVFQTIRDDILDVLRPQAKGAGWQ